MNFFRVCGDFAQFAAKIVLLKILAVDQYCIGLSLKTQILYFFVYVTRYLDLLSIFQSWYNSLFKAYFTVTTCIAVAIIFIKHKNYDAVEAKRLDQFAGSWMLAIVCGSIAVPIWVVIYWMGMPWSVPAVVEVLWHFSLGLEAFALLPQYMLMHRMKDKVDMWSCAYVFLQGSYRTWYICSWFWKYITSSYYFQPYLWLCGGIQTVWFVLYWSTWWVGLYLHGMPDKTVAAVLEDTVTLTDDPEALKAAYDPPAPSRPVTAPARAGH